MVSPFLVTSAGKYAITRLNTEEEREDMINFPNPPHIRSVNNETKSTIRGRGMERCRRVTKPRGKQRVCVIHLFFSFFLFRVSYLSGRAARRPESGRRRGAIVVDDVPGTPWCVWTWFSRKNTGENTHTHRLRRFMVFVFFSSPLLLFGFLLHRSFLLSRCGRGRFDGGNKTDRCR